MKDSEVIRLDEKLSAGYATRIHEAIWGLHGSGGMIKKGSPLEIILALRSIREPGSKLHMNPVLSHFAESINHLIESPECYVQVEEDYIPLHTLVLSVVDQHIATLRERVVYPWQAVKHTLVAEFNLQEKLVYKELKKAVIDGGVNRHLWKNNITREAIDTILPKIAFEEEHCTSDRDIVNDKGEMLLPAATRYTRESKSYVFGGSTNSIIAAIEKTASDMLGKAL